jgi:hypothetical protein
MSIRPPFFLAATLLAIAVVTPRVHAAPLVEPSSGVAFQGHYTSGGVTFVCLGTGLRKVLFWNVYAIAFCLDEAGARPAIDRYFAGPGQRYASLHGQALADALKDDASFFAHLVSADVEKRGELVFLRSTGAEKVRDTFAGKLEKSLGSAPTERSAIRDFVSVIDHDVREGDRAFFDTRAGTLSLTWGARATTLRRDRVDAAFWNGYLGPDSPLPSLKESVARGVAALRQ